MTLAAGKSQAEVAALRHLREAYDALGVANKGPSTPTRRGLTTPEALARPRSSSRVVNTVRALQHSQSTPHSEVSRVLFDQWVTLETLAQSIHADAAAVHNEIQTCELKTSEIVQLPIELADVGEPKLQVLREVLGEEAFANYVADLFRELASLRQRCALYGATLQQFVAHVKKQCDRCLDATCHSDWLEIVNAALCKLHGEAASPVLVSHLPVLMRHCSPPRAINDEETGVVVVPELLTLLKRLPPARSRLVAQCFEQIGDVRRGSGTVPPPDGVRPHKLSALAKQSYAQALCSSQELEQILQWLHDAQANGEASITMEAFQSFHLPTSDAFAAEDAAFVTYLMRVWQFESAYEPAIDAVVANYEARCQQHSMKARKVELWKKLDHARAAFPVKCAAMRLELADVSSISVVNTAQLTALEAQHATLGSVLCGLRELRLTGLCLRTFPAIVGVLQRLEALDLCDNELHEPLPLEIVGGMKFLKRLLLNDNRLNDRSFLMSSVGSEAVAQLEWDALEIVELARNELSVLPAAILQCKNLKRLDVASNRLCGCGVASNVLQHWLARGSPTLQAIDVRNNELATLPDALFVTGIESLEAIYAQDNRLTELPPSFTALTKLREAVLSRNRLRSVSSGGACTTLVAQCVQYTELIVDHNALVQFPLQSPCLELTLERLVAIRLHKNRLRTLPALSNITFAVCEELDLHGNGLTDIAESFFRAFPALRVCRLQRNRLRRLPDSLSSCSRLRTLEAYENRLAYVPPTLASLKELTVLSLRDNPLTTIPTEWHAFAACDQHGHAMHPRVLQTLSLQRNPLANRVLQTLVDSALPRSGLAPRAEPFKSSATQICELYLRKLIDSLVQSVAVQRLVRAADAEDRSSDDEQRPQRNWRGRARFAIQYVEAQLTKRCGDAAKGLGLPVAAFKKLLLKLMAASTHKELQLVAERFQNTSGVVDGVSFLCGLESMGLFGSLKPVDQEAATKDGSAVDRCESVRKPVDTVASILQYLQVAHDHKARRPATDTEPLSTRGGSHKPARGLRAQTALNTTNRTTTARRPQSATTPRAHAASTNDRSRDPRHHQGSRSHTPQQSLDCELAVQRRHYESEAARQRQRIHVLEQQLLDQQLLRLADQQTQQTAAEDTTCATASPSLLVHVKQLHTNTDPQHKAELVAVAVSPTATVRQLKEAISGRLHVAIDRQILIAKSASRANEHVRLHNDSTLATYCSSPNPRRWQVSLVVSDQLHVDWTKLSSVAKGRPSCDQGS